jgi:hypothetical protein
MTFQATMKTHITVLQNGNKELVREKNEIQEQAEKEYDPEKASHAIAQGAERRENGWRGLYDAETDLNDKLFQTILKMNATMQQTSGLHTTIPHGSKAAADPATVEQKVSRPARLTAPETDRQHR